MSFNSINILEGKNMIKSYADYVPTIKAVSDETRLRIIDILSCGELCACNILDGLSISQSTLSYHMKILTDSGLIHAKRDGIWMRYTLNKAKVEEILTFFTHISTKKADCICHKCKDNSMNK